MTEEAASSTAARQPATTEEYCKIAASRLEMKRAVIDQLRTSIRTDMVTVLIALVVLFLAMVGLGGWSMSRGSSEAPSAGSGIEYANERLVQQSEQRKMRAISALPTGTAAEAPSFPVSPTMGSTSDAGSRGSAPASLGSTFIWAFVVCWVALCAAAATLLIVRHQTMERLLLED